VCNNGYTGDGWICKQTTTAKPTPSVTPKKEILKQATATSLTLPVVQIKKSKTVTITATVKKFGLILSTTTPLTGKIQFFDGVKLKSTVSVTVVDKSTSKATWKVSGSSLGTGVHILTAKFTPSGTGVAISISLPKSLKVVVN
jgi:hypothetical protein